MTRRVRVIPVLLLNNDGLVKTLKFKEPKYVGDPINTVKILNEKGADELFLLDIGATVAGSGPNVARIAEIVSEAFVPVGYGGGLRTAGDVGRVLIAGVEKAVLNTAALESREVVRESVRRYGSQAIVASIDVRKGLFGGYQVWGRGGRAKAALDPVTCARRAAEDGAGEILVQSIDRDGTFGGYDLQLTKAVADAVDIPVVACGGAATMDDFVAAVNRGGASAVAAGSMFVFQRSRSAVLVSFPREEDLCTRFYAKLEDPR